MARMEGVPERRAGLPVRLFYWLVRRRLGKVPEPVTILAHHPTLLKGYGAFEVALERSRRVSHRLKCLVEIKTAALIGCPF